MEATQYQTGHDENEENEIFLARSQNYEERLLASSCLSVYPSVLIEQHDSHWTEFHEILVFFENLSRKFNFNYSRTRIWGTLYKDQYKILIISSSVLLIRRNVSDKSCRENQNTFHVQ